MKIKIFPKYSSKDWNLFVQGQAQVSFYHHYQWIEVMKGALDYKPKLFVALEDQKLVAVLPTYLKKGIVGGSRLITLPFGEAGLLGREKAKEKVINKLVKMARDRDYSLEIYSNQELNRMPSGLIQKDVYAYYLLPTTQAYRVVFQVRFHKKTRNMVRKAEKAGIKVSLGGKSDLKEFYSLYLKTMRKLGSLPYPFQVFVQTWKSFSREIKLLKAEIRGKTIGFLWVFRGYQSLWVWANATEEKYLPLGVNYALYSQTIKLACKNKQIKQINFGGSEPDSPQEFFKLRWGTKRKPVFLISNNSITDSKRGLQERLKPVIKNLPIFLVRIMGELAYKVY